MVRVVLQAQPASIVGSLHRYRGGCTKVPLCPAAPARTPLPRVCLTFTSPTHTHAGCYQVSYCNKKHQLAHWKQGRNGAPRHKHECPRFAAEDVAAKKAGEAAAARKAPIVAAERAAAEGAGAGGDGAGGDGSTAGAGNPEGKGKKKGKTKGRGKKKKGRR